MSSDVAIVLTAAIIVSRNSTAVEDAEVRRQQYLAAARFYSRFAPVFFLENSGYDLLGDRDFAAIPGVNLRPIAARDNEARGKGYREFHALDLWYDSEAKRPARFLKITGRYLFGNIEALLSECAAASEDLLLFDRYRFDQMALTSIFSVGWSSYARYLRSLYRQVDDPNGVWIEHLVYRSLEGAPCRFFRHEPDVGGICGSTGTSMRANQLRYFLRQATRSVNQLADCKYLRLRGTALDPLRRLLP
jgi:hypothetical protein